MAVPLKVLIVEDSLDDEILIIHELKKGGFDPYHRRVETRDDMRYALDNEKWDIIISDFYMPQFDALRAFETLRTSGLDLPFILVSGSVGEQVAVESMQAGMHDYIFKDNLSRLVPAVIRELKEARIREERRQAREALHQSYAELERRVEERTEDLRLANARLCHEIEERTRTAEALQETQDRLTLAQRAGRIGVFDWVISSGETHWTPELEHIFGLTAGEFEGTFDAWIKCIHPDDVTRLQTFFNEWFLSNRPEAQWECRIIHTSGDVRWIEARANAMRDESESPVRIIGTCLDITERKHAEQALQRQRELLDSIIDSIPVLITIYDPTLQTFRFNNELRDVLGWTEADAADGRFLERCYPDASYRAEVIRFMTSLQAGWRDLKTTAKDGTVVDCSWANIRLSDDTLIGIGIDIRARKQIEEELLRAQRDLEQRVKERTASLVEVNKELEAERVALKNKNIAMQEILSQIRIDREGLKEQMTLNIETAVMPSLQRLKMVRHDETQRLAHQVEQDLKEAVSPFLTRLRNQFGNLTPREMEICRFVKNGMSTKEIADTLSLSPMTVQKHREVIRKKLGLNNEDTNLQAYLQQYVRQD